VALGPSNNSKSHFSSWPRRVRVLPVAHVPLSAAASSAMFVPLASPMTSGAPTPPTPARAADAAPVVELDELALGYEVPEPPDPEETAAWNRSTVESDISDVSNASTTGAVIYAYSCRVDARPAAEGGATGGARDGARAARHGDFATTRAAATVTPVEDTPPPHAAIGAAVGAAAVDAAAEIVRLRDAVAAAEATAATERERADREAARAAVAEAEVARLKAALKLSALKKAAEGAAAPVSPECTQAERSDTEPEKRRPMHLAVERLAIPDEPDSPRSPSP